ncbi:MAG: peptidoglycan-associated lipoprotein Pal [Burkholderiaceae bacterium]|nr:peptidoglycan-associated lipoprotein Pal [Burkholderiaceae bacterium]
MKTRFTTEIGAESVAEPSTSRFSFGWRQTAVALFAAVALAGCGSSVKLDESAPVTDRTGVSAQDAAGAADARGVAPVQADSAQLAEPPAGIARLIYFDFDEYAIRPEFMPVLEAHARFLSANRDRQVVLEGHTDIRGTREYNLALGQRRSEAVRRALSLMGVSDAQMEAVSFGKEKLANPGFTEDAHAQNRRVEITYRR